MIRISLSDPHVVENFEAIMTLQKSGLFSDAEIQNMMKAISLWQPWASLLACGAKQFETRSWPTSYRGPIAIHAAARPTRSALYQIGETDALFGIYAALQESGLVPKCPKPVTLEYFIHGNEALPLGCVIATAELVGCHPIAEIGWSGTTERRIAWIDSELNPHYPTERELQLGDWTPGRYAWEFANIKMLDTPIPAKGKQGLWNWISTEAAS